MARVKGIQSLRDRSLSLEARIIAAVGAVGPRNVAEISRLVGAPQETVRYDIKTRLGRLGFRYHAEVDWDKLGLTQHWASLRFSPRYAGSELRVFEAMNGACYLTYYTKIVPQGRYLAIFSIPAGTTTAFEGFLGRLRDQGVLTDFTLDEVIISRHPPMNPKFFDFSRGRWNVDWERIRREPTRPLPPEQRPATQLPDYDDLLLVKELQKDALQHTTDVAKRLGRHSKTAEYHFRRHVEHKLIRSFIVRWTQDIQKKLAHSVAFTRVTFKQLERHELARVQGAVSRIPFLWAEDLLRSGTYVATLYTPIEEALGTLSYLDDEVPYLGSRVEIGYLKPHDSYLYTIPHNMFVNGEWSFDPERMESTVLKTTPRIVER